MCAKLVTQKFCIEFPKEGAVVTENGPNLLVYIMFRKTSALEDQSLSLWRSAGSPIFIIDSCL